MTETLPYLVDIEASADFGAAYFVQQMRFLLDLSAMFANKHISTTQSQRMGSQQKSSHQSEEVRALFSCISVFERLDWQGVRWLQIRHPVLESKMHDRTQWRQVQTKNAETKA
jgi:hypothetical protein